MKLKHTLALAIVAVGVSLSTATVMAQNDNNGSQGGSRGRRNFDPAQFQQYMMDHYKDALEVKDDAEWSALQPLVQKVMDARRESFSGIGRGMFGGGRRSSSGDSASSDQGSSRRSSGFFGPPSPEAEALQKAIDAKASKAEIKAALEKYTASRKAKQAQLEQAQENLRKVLTSRQEAIATLNGLL